MGCTERSNLFVFYVDDAFQCIFTKLRYLDKSHNII